MSIQEFNEKYNGEYRIEEDLDYDEEVDNCRFYVYHNVDDYEYLCLGTDTVEEADRLILYRQEQEAHYSIWEE